MTDHPGFCPFRWRDRDGDHVCALMDDGHPEHACCCGATCWPAGHAQPKRRKARR